MRASVLSARDLQVRYPVRTGVSGRRGVFLRALDGVSFELAPGEALGVVGESGCGKSSLGRASLLLTRPAAGRVFWRGEDVTLEDEKSLRARRRHIQIVFQDPLSSLNPRMTAGEIIAEPLRSFFPRRSDRDVDAGVSEMMRRVGLLPNMKLRYPHEFSGGQCQRISIARAAILRPEVLVLDEPVSALDVSVQAQIVNLLQDLQAELGLSYLFISHDLSIVRYVCDRILVMYLGKVVETGPRESLFGEPRHPYTKALVGAIPVPDPERRRRAAVAPGAFGELPSPLNPPAGCRFHTRCPFASERCREEEPRPEPAGPGHEVACHHWRDLVS